VDCQQQYEAGTTVTLTAEPGQSSSFSGWSGDCSGSQSTCVVTMTASRQVTASFATEQAQPVLSVVKAGAGAGRVTSEPSGIDCGADCSHAYVAGTSVTLTATPGAGSDLTGWSVGGCGTATTCTVAVNGSLTVTATFEAEPTLSVAVQGAGGTVSSTPAGIDACAEGPACTATFDGGSSVSLTASYDLATTVLTWGGACTAEVTDTCQVTLNSDTTVTATFEPLVPPPP
jgi:hypothetical protein